MVSSLVALSFLVSLAAILLTLISARRLSVTNLALEQRAKCAERNLRHLGDLANEVAHEIKNPLTAILCSAETLHLVLGDQIEETHRKSLKYMTEHGECLLRLVSDFLDLSCAETHQLDIHPENISLAGATDSLTGLLNAQAMKSGVTLESSIDERIQIMFDAKHIKQVLFNLLHNAIKFTPSGGQVLIQAQRDLPRGKVRIVVSDTGVGIDSDRLEEIFEPYWTSVRPMKDQFVQPGTGLGLSLCRALVSINGGELHVESKVGAGTTFWFEVVSVEEEAPVSTEPRESHALEMSTAPLIGQRFLVIDGDNGITEQVAQLIEAWGGMVDAVESACDMVNALAYENYDAVMVEGISQEGIYPDELVELAKAHRKSEETTVIFSSVSQEDGHAGADSLLKKPYSGKNLLQSLLQTGKYSTTH